ncbi:MAG: hypothetical protein JSR66_01250 [Proteobacteria bacterium]|nr:hypothetical protein [Pseudomonadota bacterium]
MTVKLTVNDAVWDAAHGLIHVVTAAASPARASSIVSIDPKTGLVQASRSLGGEPNTIALSGDAQYVYAGLKKGGGIVRIHTANLTEDITIPVGTATTTVQQIRVSPMSPTTIAVIADNLDAAGLNNRPGVEIFDNAVLRPSILQGILELSPTSGLVVSASDLHWSADAMNLDATMNFTAEIARLNVSAGGLTVAEANPWPITAPGRINGTRTYLDDGRVLDFAGPVQQLGKFVDYDNPVWSRAELLANQKSFSVQNHMFNSPFGPAIDGMTWNAFDVNTFNLTDTITFKGLLNAMHGKLISWSTNGLAWADADGFIIASGSFAEAGGAEAQAAAPAMVASGSFEGTNGTVRYTVLNFGANDIAVDSCNHLYVATSGASNFRPNSVVTYDVQSGMVTNSAYAGSEPYILAASQDCSAVYATLFYSNSVARLSAPNLAVEAVLPLNGGTSALFPFALGRSISIAPGSSSTVAIARAQMQTQQCGDGDLGVAIFDGTRLRPAIYNPEQTGIKSLAWGGDANTVYGENSLAAFFALAVDSTGVTGATRLNPDFNSDEADTNIGRDLSFDPITRHLYRALGRGFDTVAGTAFGPLPLRLSAATDLCGTPLGAEASDPGTGKVFYVTYGSVSGPSGQLGIATFLGSTLTPIDQAVITETPIPTDYGVPRRVVRLLPDRLALVTSSGNVVILQGPMLLP